MSGHTGAEDRGRGTSRPPSDAEPGLGLDPRTPGLRPEPKSVIGSTEPPGVPEHTGSLRGQ